MSQEKLEDVWPAIKKEERTLHEILFYSQGPVDGYILGEGIRDLLLKSGLSLTVLSQIWNLADVSNDNVLNVHEFVLIMHLIRGVLGGRAVPKTLPRTLVPPKTSPQTPPSMTQQEKDAYLRVFQTLDYSRAGYIDGLIAAEMFLATKLPLEVLAHIWDLSEFGRDGKLNPEKFAIACHLLRYAKQGGSLEGPVDIFHYSPQHVSPLSLLARKRRVSEYEEHKQRLMTLKERRKIQAVREARRLDLAKEKVARLQELFELLKKFGTEKESEADRYISKTILKDKADNEKQEEIALRLKREHEKVRQETVKIILGEQRFHSDITIIKKDTDELNKRLLSSYTHATKDPDPFHQLFEQRKEKRQGSTIKDLDKIEIYIPFEFSPFDLNVTPDSLPSGLEIISKGNNHKNSLAEVKSVIADLKEFGEDFMDVWGEPVSLPNDKTKEFEDDEIFREVHDWSDDTWPQWDWTENGLLGLTDPQIVRVKQKLIDLREELRKLNSEGGRLVFRNSEDYYARRKALEEEEKVEKGRLQRRSLTERIRSGSTNITRSRDPTKRYSYTADRTVSIDSSQAARAAREYRLKRRSQTYDSASSSPEFPRKPDREQRLDRTSADPTSDEGSLSRESSLSSFDQPVSLRGSSRRFEEESSTIRTQDSSRTDDSGILTFKSNEQKDDFSLALTRSPVIPPSAEVISTPMFSEDIKRLSGDENISQNNQTLVTKLSEQSREDNKENDHNTLCDTSFNETNSLVNISTSSVNRRSSKKHRAPAPPSTASPVAPFYDAPGETDTPTSSHNKAPGTLNDSHIDSNGPAKINVTAVVQPALERTSTDKKSEIKEITNISEKENTPQRPPRHKKRNSPSECSQDQVSPDALSPTTQSTPVPDIEFVSKARQSPTNIKEIKVNSNEVGTQKSYEIKPISVIQLGSDPENQTSTSKSVLPSSKEFQIRTSDPSFSLDQIALEITNVEPGFSKAIEKKEQPEAENKQAFTNSNTKNNIDVEGHAEARQTKDQDSSITQSDTMLRASLSPGVSPTSIGSESNKIHMSSDLDNSKPLNDDVLLMDSSPPPLPSSAPPPLPASVPPKATEVSADSEEDVVIVEYTVPLSLSSGILEDSHALKYHETPSSTYLNGSLEESSNKIASPSITTANELSSESNKNIHETNKESTPKSKTISDLRSDFFGLKTRRTNTDVLESDLIATPTTRPRDLFYGDILTQNKINKRSGFGNSVDSDVSDSDSGVPMNFGDDTFSPGDSGPRNSSSATSPESKTETTFVSSERRYVPSNDSIESAFEDSLSVSSGSSSFKQPQLSATLLDDTPTSSTTRNKNSSVVQEEQVVVSKVENLNSAVTSHAKKTLSTFEGTRSFEGTPTISEKNGNNISTKNQKLVKEAEVTKETVHVKHDQVPKKEVPVLIPEDTMKISSPNPKIERMEVNSEKVQLNQVNAVLSPPESSQSVGKSLKSANPSEYGFVYSADRPKPAPEAGWSEKQGNDQKVNLYSENVLQEKDTTESVDRESIANLASTKRQWEDIFTSHSTNQVESSIKPKAAPKWEVRLPYKEKHSAQATNEANISTNHEEEEASKMFKKPANTESAIEREIRLAHEREEMLRKEKEERQKLAEKQKSQTFIASYATSSAESESNQPAYHELAEADRNPNLWRVEHEDKKDDDDKNEDNEEVIYPQESFIEREIRLQKEREAEISRMRKLAQQQLQPQRQEQHISQSKLYHTQHEDHEDINHNQTKVLHHVEPVAGSTNEIENRIIRELQELKEREEEIRKLHGSLQGTHVIDETDGPREGTSSLQKSSSTLDDGFSQLGSPSSHGSWQKDLSFLSPQRRESVDSTSSQSTSRSQSDGTPSRREVKVRPIADSYNDDDEDKKTDYFQKQETPIKREIRLARERENELRKQKGLPEIIQTDDDPYGSYGTDHESSSINAETRSHSSVQPGNTLKKFASNRLQQELQEQKERELALVSEGKIITTSEQHIQPLKFAEVAGIDRTDGTLKRNFSPRKINTSYIETEEPQVQQEITSPSGQSARKPGAVAAGGQLFSYREFKQSAESKIERELREMKEREEELRKQRTGTSATSPP